MAKLTPEEWKDASPYLDDALGMDEHQRAAWLAAFREHNPAVGKLLENLLAEHRAASEERFLEQGPLLPPTDPAAAGEFIGTYCLRSPIGHGGMGTVWLAERSDGRFQRKVAIKFPNIALHGGPGQERFKREGSLLGRLAHRNIAELIDAGVSGTAQPYLVLEYVDGEPIDQYCDHHKLGIEARVRLFLDVLSAVAHAHSHLIVHRDIKPSNVLVTYEGCVKLLDFGIAKLLEEQGLSGEATLLTRDGGAGLTPAYAAPEQITGRPVTTATDVYSLGVVLYLLLTGQHPADSGNHSTADLVKAIVETEPPRPSDCFPSDDLSAAASRASIPDRLRRQLRGDLDTIVGKALKKDAGERYASAEAFADDLLHYLRHQPIAARPESLAYRTGKFVRRNRTAVGLAALAFLAALAGVFGTFMQARSAREQRDFAYRQLSRAEAVNELNNFLLHDAAPSGKPFTASELLGRAEHIVERQYGLSNDRVELLVSIGRQYASADQDGKARALLEQAYALSRGLSDPLVRSKASCALADTLSNAGEQERAEALFREGLAELPQTPEYTLDRVYCLSRGHVVATRRGDAQAGIARARAAQQLLDASPFRSDSGDLHVVIDLAEAYRSAGQFDKAIANFEQASRLMTSLGRDQTANAGTLYNNWALALYQMGRPLEAEPIFRHAIRIDQVDNTDRAVSPMTLINYARTLQELGHLDEAAKYAQAAYLKAVNVDQQVVISQSLIERARIYRQQGDLARAEAMLAKVEPRFRRDLPPGHYAFAALATERSLISLARGDTQNAIRLAQEAVTIDEAAIKAGGQGAGVLPILLFRRSAIELKTQQLGAAASDAARAVSLLRAGTQPRTYSCYLGRAYVILGLVEQAQGHPDEARASFQLAAEHLQNTLGPDHPDTRSAGQLVENPTLRGQIPPLG
jgi:tetratricopeptide (TPR) repeat protein